MTAIDKIYQDLDFQSSADIMNPASINGVQNLTASKLVLSDGSKNIVSSTLAEGDIVTAGSTHTLTNKTFDANGTGNSISNIEVADFASSVTLDAINAPTSSVDANSQKITNLATPTSANDAVNKSYADSIAAGITDFKDSVRAASTANVTIASELENGDALDGVTLATNDRVLLKNQTDASQNGIYVVAASGAASRSADADADTEVTSGLYVYIEEGTANSGDAYVLNTTGAITVDTTDLSFSKFSGAGLLTAGDGLSKSADTLSVNVDDSSVEVSADALRVKALGITADMLAGSIPDSKLSTITTADKVSGSAIQIKTGAALSDSTGLQVVVDNSTLEVASGSIRQKDDGTTFAKLATDAKPYEGTFNNTTDWTSSVLTITATTHGLGTAVEAVFFQNGSASSFDKVNVSYNVASNGDVSLEVISGVEFAGKVVIKRTS